MKRVINNSSGERLIGDLTRKKPNKSLIIACHGFNGNREYILFKKLAEKAVKAGFDLFCFDFSGNGESDGVFGDSGLIKEKNDLISVIKEFKDYKNIILLGHSMGGAVSLITAGSSRRVKAVIVISPLVFPTISFKDSILEYNPSVIMSKIDKERFMKSLKKDREKLKDVNNNLFFKAKKTLFEVINKKGLNKAFFNQAYSVDVTDYVERLRKPLLIIHGRHDEVIPFSHAEYLYNQNKKYSELLLMNLPHTPRTKPSIESVNNTIINWLASLNL